MIVLPPPPGVPLDHEPLRNLPRMRWFDVGREDSRGLWCEPCTVFEPGAVHRHRATPLPGVSTSWPAVMTWSAIMTKTLHLCKRSTSPNTPLGCLSASSCGPLEGGPCKRTASALVTAPPTRVGLQTQSRHKAYGNTAVAGVPKSWLPFCCKHSHAIRRMETKTTRGPRTNSGVTLQTQSRHKAYGNVGVGVDHFALEQLQTQSRHKAYGNLSPGRGVGGLIAPVANTVTP